MQHLNACFAKWLAEVGNVRCHGTTGRIVEEAFGDEQPKLTRLPNLGYDPVLAIERKVSEEGMISYDGNLYSLPVGKGHRILDSSHRKAPPCELEALHELYRKVTAQRPLWFYDAVAQRLVVASEASS